MKLEFDREKTKLFYENYEVCNCVYCRNFRKVISSSYSELVHFLEQFGIITGKPVEAFDYSWADDTKSKRLSQSIYSVYSSIDSEFEHELTQEIILHFLKSDKLFDTGMAKPYFLIEVNNLKLEWQLEEKLRD